MQLKLDLFKVEKVEKKTKMPKRLEKSIIHFSAKRLLKKK